MNLQSTMTLYAYGTSEGVEKEWDTRGRGRKITDQHLMDAGNAIADAWMKKAKELDPNSTSKKKVYWWGPQKGGRVGVQVLVNPEENGDKLGNINLSIWRDGGKLTVKAGDSWVPKAMEGKGIYSAGMDALMNMKLPMSGRFYVHHSSNDPAWTSIAKKHGLEFIDT